MKDEIATPFGLAIGLRGHPILILSREKMENFQKNLPFVKTVTYKNSMILGTHLPLNPMTDLYLTRRISRP
jgi:hypothetical protein